jgi:hypothetical protein
MRREVLNRREQEPILLRQGVGHEGLQVSLSEFQNNLAKRKKKKENTINDGGMRYSDADE